MIGNALLSVDSVEWSPTGLKIGIITPFLIGLIAILLDINLNQQTNIKIKKNPNNFNVGTIVIYVNLLSMAVLTPILLFTQDFTISRIQGYFDLKFCVMISFSALLSFHISYSTALLIDSASPLTWIIVWTLKETIIMLFSDITGGFKTANLTILGGILAFSGTFFYFYFLNKQRTNNKNYKISKSAKLHLLKKLKKIHV
ncbi:solute carrier family 35 [Anaeramoeba flamelloides]|uniref:Solute carrier family n=1 Tax=Anaeramoeba flamelloides TaxID=1746091 RepID=A0AAV8A6E2_9EUKA|nr:solute carrier family [Anaeramoeba flamelloides]KAJ6249733.1 solute carrier family 35 [Anaeramoeba flamelloides]